MYPATVKTPERGSQGFWRTVLRYLLLNLTPQLIISSWVVAVALYAYGCTNITLGWTS